MKIRYILILLLLFVTTTVFAVEFPKSTQSLSSATSVIRTATQQTFSGKGTSYTFLVRTLATNDYARFFIPISGMDAGTLTYSTASDSDSVFVSVRYGTANGIGSGEKVYYAPVVQDSSLYWYKAQSKSKIDTNLDIFPAPWLVVDVSAAGGTWTNNTTVEVFIKEE